MQFTKIGMRNNQLMIASARTRTESRGVHLRSDFPQTDVAQASHLDIIATD